MNTDDNCVLIVDDDADIRQLLIDMLEHSNYRTLCASSGQEAVDYFESERPAVALIDLLLEDIPGLAVMREIKTISPTTECIVITGKASQDACIAAVKLGAYGFHQKPFAADHMLATIRAAIERGQEVKALQAERDFYQGIAEYLPCAMAISDADGTVRYVNPAFQNLTDINAETIVGSPPPYPWTDKGTVTKSDGQEIPVQIASNTITEDDHPVCTIQTFHPANGEA